MSQDFYPGDFLVFQLESGYGLLRVLDVIDDNGSNVWHLAAYEDLFLDVEMAETALQDRERLKISHPHIALTERAFNSTQVAKISSAPLQPFETEAYIGWQASPAKNVSDRSVRLILGLR
jgi:hypothetical protein